MAKTRAATAGRDGPGSASPAIVRAAAFDPARATWRLLPDSDAIGGSLLWWRSGDRVVNASRGGADGGDVGNYGKVRPFGAIFDPATSAWSDLPAVEGDEPTCGPSTGYGSGDGPDVGGPDVVVRGWMALHVRERRWERVPCQADPPPFGASWAWVGGGVVMFGGYRIEPGTAAGPNEYEFTDRGWRWRPSG